MPSFLQSISSWFSGKETHSLLNEEKHVKVATVSQGDKVFESAKRMNHSKVECDSDDDEHYDDADNRFSQVFTSPLSERNDSYGKGVNHKALSGHYDPYVRGSHADPDVMASTPATHLKYSYPSHDSQPTMKGMTPFPCPNRREREPMKFNGKTDWRDYLGHFTAVAEWNRWNYEELGLQLAISLTDEAREVLGSLTGAEQYDFETLKGALTRRFSPEGKESQYSLQLMNLTCKPGETVTSYGQTMRRLANRAYPESLLDEKVLVDLYIRGLPDYDMKRHVYLAKPVSLTEAINSAVAYEAFDMPKSNLHERLHKPKPGISAIKPQDASTTALCREDKYDKLAETVKQIASTVSQLTGSVNKLAQSRQSDPSKYLIECFKCHRKGHYARDCTTNTGIQSKSIGPRNGKPYQAPPNSSQQTNKTRVN